MHHPELEICAYSVEAALTAQKTGADRVELCSAFAEGGLTPSAGAIRLARKYLKIELYVMIRPRGSDFCYNEIEIEQMFRDIDFAKSCGANGVALGVLQPNGHVNITRTRELVQFAAPLKTTFHRAFDMTVDPFRALDDAVICGCRRILTSGGKKTAAEGIETIRELVCRADGRIDIMAGSGVNPANARIFIDAGVQALHLSAKARKQGKMIYRNPDVSFMQTGAVSEYDLLTVDEEQIRKMVHLIRRH